MREIQMVKDMFASIKKAISLNKRTINRKNDYNHSDERRIDDRRKNNGTWKRIVKYLL